MQAPRLTVKSIARILTATKAQQSKILRDHKYPKREPQVHQPPYYQVAVGGVRSYYRSNNNSAILTAAHSKALSIGNKTKRDHNVRIIENFRDSPLAARHLTVHKSKQFTAKIDRIVVRLSADMQALEDGSQRVVYFHCRGEALDEAAAVLMADIAHWVMKENKVELQPSQIEVMDLSNGKSYRARAWNAATLTTLRARAPVIGSIWDQL